MDGTVLINELGFSIGLNVLLPMIVTVIIIVGLCFIITRQLSVEHPGKLQLAFEWLISLMRGIVQDAFGDETKASHIVVALTVFLFILIANLLGLPILVDIHHLSYWKSPTADLAVCLAMAIVMNLISQYYGIKKNGVINHFRLSYAHPLILLPYNVLEELINIITLSLRLFGNIFAGEILLKLIADMGNSIGVLTWPIGIPLQIIWQGFSIFVGGLQAYIFVNLSIVYLSHKVVNHEKKKKEK